MIPIIFHIPHSSTLIPPEYRDQFIISDEILKEAIRLMTDHFTDELFISADDLKESAVVFPISRICLDPERFMDDTLEIMFKKGMGVIYTHSYDGSPIRRNLTTIERSELLNKFYKPHHERLETIVRDRLKTDNKCLIVDCHSFPDKPLPYESDQSTDRPDLCIGTDDFHTPSWLAEECINQFESYGFKTTINTPFGGSFVPGKYYMSNKNVLSVMIEVNRKLYMDEDRAIKNENFGKIKQTINHILKFQKIML